MLALLLLQDLEPEGWGMRSVGHQKESSFILKNKTGFQNGEHSKCGIMLVWAHFYLICFLFEKCFGSHPTLAELRDQIAPLFVKTKLYLLKPQTWTVN